MDGSREFLGYNACNGGHKMRKKDFLCKFVLMGVVILLCSPVGFSGDLLRSDAQSIIKRHDLSTALAMGKYYLKGQALVAIRKELSQLGTENKFGPDWTESNLVWRRAEQKLLDDVYEPIESEFSSLSWLYPLWESILLKDYNANELEQLSRHFSSEVGKKQTEIIDHYISLYVMRTLTFSGKLQDIAGAEGEKNEMQNLYVKQDSAVFFSVRDSDNAEGQAFALSPLGKKYFADNVIKLVGEFNQHMYELANSISAQILQGTEDIDLIVEEFQKNEI